jgi:hypothetical protein
MATERLRTIKSSGGDYTSLSNWEAGEQGNLITQDIWVHASCYPMRDTTPVVFNGWVTDSTHYIKVDSPEGYRHQGVFDNTKYYLNVSGYHCMTIYEDYIFVDHLQIQHDAGDSTIPVNAIYMPYIFIKGAKHCDIYNNIIFSKDCYGSYALTGCMGILSDDVIGLIRIWNNIIFGFGYSSDRGNGAIALSLDGEGDVYNNTIVNCDVGLYVNVNYTVKNCIFSNCKTDAILFDFLSDSYCSTTNNNTKGLTPSVTSNRFSQTFSFRNITNSDYHLKGIDTGALGYGVTNPGNSLFNDDVDGVTRSIPWDIGADQYSLILISFNGIISNEFFGGFKVFLNQKIFLEGILSQEIFGDIRLREIIAFVGLISNESFGIFSVLSIQKNPFFVQMEKDLLDGFINNLEFAEEVIFEYLNGSTQELNVIFDNESTVIDPETGVPVMSRIPLLWVQTSEFNKPIEKGLKVLIRGIKYQVIKDEPDGTGLTQLTLHREKTV